MKKIVLKVVVLFVIALFANLSNVYADGATVSLEKNSVKPGETVELYIELSTESIGYDIRITPTSSNLISSTELVNRIGEGNTARIYLVQLASNSQKTVYQPGTRIATLRYKISDSAKAGDKIKIDIAGDVAGKNSTEKNTMSESVTVNIVEDNIVKQEENKSEINKQEENTNKNIETPVTTEKTEQIQSSQTNALNSTKTASVPNVTTTQNKNITVNNTTKNADNLPKTGIETDMPIVVGVILLIVVQISMGIRLIRNK